MRILKSCKKNSIWPLIGQFFSTLKRCWILNRLVGGQGILPHIKHKIANVWEVYTFIIIGCKIDVRFDGHYDIESIATFKDASKSHIQVFMSVLFTCSPPFLSSAL